MRMRMELSQMSKEERVEYLAETHICVIGVDRPGRAPLTVPIWYDYEPGGELMIWTEKNSVKAGLIADAGQFSACVHNEDHPYRYVSTAGPLVAIEDPAPADKVRQISSRYLSGADLDTYLADLGDAELVVIRMRPEKWSTMKETQIED